MNKLWKFLFFLTWLVIITVLILLAIFLTNKDSYNQNQQIINQYVAKGNGLSAYDVAVKQGFIGDEKAWLESLNGKDGRDGKDSHSTSTVVEKQVNTETTVIEQVPVEGKSSYQVWLSLGNAGTEEDYLLSLKGEPGVSPELVIRFNQDLGLFQTKKVNDTFWKTVPTCGGITGRVCN